MTANGKGPRRGDVGGPESTSADQDVETPTTVDPPADTKGSQKRGPRLLEPAGEQHRVVLELHHDPVDLGHVLELLADTAVRPGSRAGLMLGDLVAQLMEAGVVERALEEYRQQWHDAAVEQYVSVASRVWRWIVIDTAPHSGPQWNFIDLCREWNRYLDPATGQPYPLPRGWEARGERLERDGMPWRLAQVQVHATLTGTGPRTFHAFIRSSRKTLAKLRGYTVHEAERKLDRAQPATVKPIRRGDGEASGSA